MTFRNKKEMETVIGPLGDNSFLKELRASTEKFTTDIKSIFHGLTK